MVALLADPKRRIWFAGGRFSQYVAGYLCLQMRMLRPGCAVVGESPQRRKLDTYEISRRDVVCLFDYRRYQQDTIAAGKVAADHGAVVVVFTDPWLSPAVEHARHVLISHADSASPFDSLLGAFALTEVIAAKVVVALGDRGRTRVAELETGGRGPARSARHGDPSRRARCGGRVSAAEPRARRSPPTSRPGSRRPACRPWCWGSSTRR